MLGFEFLENFNYPYISKSVTEFWRRWHISLGTWFRDYVYIPLGGNRKGPWRQIFNLLIVWALTGFWHGANWTFLCWGLYYAVFLIIEKLFLLKGLKRVPVIATIYTLLVAVCGWVLFDLPSLSAAGSYYGAMFGFAGGGLAAASDLFYLKEYAVVFIVCIFFDAEKKMPEIHAALRERAKKAAEDRGEVYIEPEEQDRLEMEAAAKELEESRIAELRELCEKKGLNFEEEEARYQAQLAAKKAKAEAKAAKRAKK
jgi:hypothetical protein